MILQNSDELKKISLAVPVEEGKEIVKILEKELKNSPIQGIGLAAPQIGLLKRVAIVRMENKKIDLINPKIIKTYDKSLFYDEGCLSFPGKNVRTTRFQEIVVQNDIEPYKFIAVGLFAVCIQHEIDHLDGIIIFDRMA